MSSSAARVGTDWGWYSSRSLSNARTSFHARWWRGSSLWGGVGGRRRRGRGGERGGEWGVGWRLGWRLGWRGERGVGWGGGRRGCWRGGGDEGLGEGLGGAVAELVGSAGLGDPRPGAEARQFDGGACADLFPDEDGQGANDRRYVRGGQPGPRGEGDDQLMGVHCGSRGRARSRGWPRPATSAWR